MYVPKKLQETFELIQEKHGTNIIVQGVVSCCSQHDFTISYLGELKTNWLGHKSIFPENDTIVLMAKCKTCGKEIQVFNSYTDGYDNCVNNSLPPSLSGLANFSCPKCLKDYFSIELSFEYQSKEELEEDGVQEYENAFSWIWVSLICSSCKRTFKNLVDMETS
jgi:hypothetical protein